MNLLAEHKTSLKYYAALFLLFGFILLLCGALFENENSELGKHQETMYRQDQVHYWAGIPFIVLAIVSVLFLILEYNFLLKFCICLDYICINIAIFVVIVEAPDWKKYQAKSNHYDNSGDIDYQMLKPQQDYGSYSQLGKSYYESAMYYSGTWVFVAICSILLGVETFLTHIKVYCGIESIYAYLSGYELVNPEIILKRAKPIEKFECKGCQTTPQTPTQPSVDLPIPTKVKLPKVSSSPPTVIRAPVQQTIPEDKPNRSVSPAPSDASNASSAFYVCQEADGIKLVGYKPRRRGLNQPHLCTHQEEEEGQTDYYHFSRKHPSDVMDPNNSYRVSLPQDPKASPSIPLPPSLSPLVPQNTRPGEDFSRDHESEINDPNNGHRMSNTKETRVSPNIPIPPALPPLEPQNAGGKSNQAKLDRSPGRYPSVGNRFPSPSSTLLTPGHGREKGRVSFQDPRRERGGANPGTKRSSKLDTLF